MHKIYKQFSEILSPREIRNGWLVVIFMLVSAIADAVGVASILPFMQVLSNPERVLESEKIRTLYTWSGADGTKEFLVMFAVAVTCTICASIIIKAASFWFQVRYAHGRVHSISCRLLNHYLSLPYEWHKNTHTAEMSRILLSEVGQAVHGAMFTGMQGIAQAMVVCAMSLLLVLANPMVAITAAASLSVIYLAIYLGIKRSMQDYGATRENANKGRFKAVQEIFGGIREIKLFHAESLFLKKFETPSELLGRVNTRSKMASEAPSMVMQALIYGGTMACVMLVVIYSKNFSEAIPLIALYAFAGYRLLPAMQSMFSSVAEMNYSQSSVDALYRDVQRAKQYAETETSRPEPAVIAEELDPNVDGVCLQGVSYRYPGASTNVISNINLTIERGSVVGFVGRTGSGKSTLVDLIVGLLKPSSGNISGTEIGADDTSSRMSSQIGYVPQNIFLTDDTIMANIAFGERKEDVDIGVIERVSLEADLAEFVDKLPKKYLTMVGERGASLSGGQRQRIGIARALYRNPSLIVFDEATSALDGATERTVMDSVLKFRGKRTVILVAHKLETVRNCDKIFLLEEGSVAAVGSFADLSKNNARFRSFLSVEDKETHAENSAPQV